MSNYNNNETFGNYESTMNNNPVESYNDSYGIDIKKDYSNFDRVKRTKALGDENRNKEDDFKVSKEYDDFSPKL